MWRPGAAIGEEVDISTRRESRIRKLWSQAELVQRSGVAMADLEEKVAA